MSKNEIAAIMLQQRQTLLQLHEQGLQAIANPCNTPGYDPTKPYVVILTTTITTPLPKKWWQK